MVGVLNPLLTTNPQPKVWWARPSPLGTEVRNLDPRGYKVVQRPHPEDVGIIGARVIHTLPIILLKISSSTHQPLWDRS
jgi:hypothetical protein